MKEKIEAISMKVDGLILRNADLSSENQSLKSENQEFQRLINAKNSEIEGLKDQIEQLRKNAASDSEFDVENYKNKLN